MTLTMDKQLYEFRANQNRWGTSVGSEEVKTEQEIEIIDLTQKDEEMEEVQNESANRRVSAEDIIKNIIKPQRRGKMSGKQIRIQLKPARVIISEMQMFDFGFPKSMAFSFAEGHVFVLPSKNEDAPDHYKVVKYGTTNQFVIQNKVLVSDIVSHLNPNNEDKSFIINACEYMETGDRRKIYELKLKK
jgi:hypothetical protein